MSKKQKKHISLRLLTILGLVLFLGFLLGVSVSLFHFTIGNALPTTKITDSWLQYDMGIFEKNGSFLSSFKYPAGYRVFESDSNPTGNQELTMSVGQNNQANFTIDVLRSDLTSAIKQWATGYGKTQTMTINRTQWTYFSSKDCINQQTCASDDIYYLSGTSSHQLLVHFPGSKEITQFQKSILTKISFKEIIL